MQFENFDKKIKDLLSQRPPDHDNPAWDKMEQLLDKHLPQQKKDRRRVIIFFFLFLFVGGGAFLMWQNSGGHEDSNNITGNKQEVENPQDIPTIKKDSKTVNKNANSVSVESLDNTNNRTERHQQATNSEIKPILTENKNFDQKALSTNNTNRKKNSISKDNNIPPQGKPTATKKINASTKDPDAVGNKNVTVEELTKPQTDLNPATNEKQAPQKEIESEKQVDKTENVKTNEKSEVAQTPKANKQKNNKSFGNNFFITLSAGPDFSAVSGTAGKVQLAWGGGVGYQISRKFSVRTGFYVTRKIYSADPEDYHPPTNFWQYYPNLKSIDANCKVFEIPITIDYNISTRKKSSWFVSGGVSSLLMKEETYEYYFKPNSSPNYISYSRTINNKNKHYFSVLDLSGGYKRILNNHISLQAEPYVKIAMSGIGYGKVDLNSAGILVSAVIKPFASKK